MKICGIYIVRNIINNKVYIGSSNKINVRIRTHKWELNKNIHSNQYLQNAWNKYGKENFIFEIIEECEVDELLLKELLYTERYNSLCSENGYNLVIPFRLNEEQTSNQNYRNKLSIIKKGIKPSNYEYCKKMQKRAILEYENGILIKEYESAKEAGDFLNIDYKLINNVLRKVVKKIRKYPNKTWLYKEGGIKKIKKKKSNMQKLNCKPIIILNDKKEIINRYNSIKEASNLIPLTRGLINHYLKNEKLCKKYNIYLKYETI
jgi:hypothetical protein